MSSLRSLLGSSGLWSTQASAALECDQQLLYCAGRLFSILVTSAVRSMVFPGSRASSCLLTTGTTESGKVWSDCGQR